MIDVLDTVKGVLAPPPGCLVEEELESEGRISLIGRWTVAKEFSAADGVSQE